MRNGDGSGASDISDTDLLLQRVSGIKACPSDQCLAKVTHNPANNLPSSITGNYQVLANTSFSGLTFVEPGAVLTIAPGVVLRGITGTPSPSTLIVKPGGRINAVGTNGSPITITSANATSVGGGGATVGDIGGIAILGRSTVNEPNATLEARATYEHRPARRRSALVQIFAGSLAVLAVATPTVQAKSKPTVPPPAAVTATGPCNPAGTFDAVIALTPPPDVALTGLKLTLTYPAGVSIPGDADEASVKQRVQMLPGGVLYSPNDEDGHTVIALVGTEVLPTGPIATIKFDRCAGRPAPAAGDFTCHVDQGSDREGKLLLDGIACALTQTQKEKGR